MEQVRAQSSGINDSPDLARFDNRWYDPGRSIAVRALWFLVGLPMLRCPLIPAASFRRVLLHMFGARLGQGVVIKPGARVKNPWFLVVGNNSWIGEDAWIDNIAPVEIGHNVCISQGVYICTGNHDWSDPAFGLVARSVILGDGSWIGARAIICPGVTVGHGAIAAAGSVVTRNIPALEIHAGNPAHFIRLRRFRGDIDRAVI